MIIATAGHVDHGKTSLVKALSGTDTDRLPEEKKRGLTIDIGFAYIKANEGHTSGAQQIALIDVPGHEKFVRNMIAGVGLVDVALLVVASDDGPMPQTLEHIAILKLMGIRQIVPVVSKADLVDPPRVAEVIVQTTALLKAADVPATEVTSISVTDQSQVKLLKAKLLDCIASQPLLPAKGKFRMAIDRCFTLDGSGTVVTGTVASGQVEKNETVVLSANNSGNGNSSRVRGLHAQNAEAESAMAGQRCALNLSGELSKSDLQRGGWLLADTNSVQTSVVDVALTPALDLENAGSLEQLNTGKASPLKHWTPAHFHIGTADIPCRIALLDCTEVERGNVALARLMCERPFTAVHGDRFVLRDQSARKTIAGGTVLDVMPPRRGRSKPERLIQLQALHVDEPQDALHNLLELNKTGIDLTSFSQRFNLLQAEIDGFVTSEDLKVISTSRGLWCLRKVQSKALQAEIVESLQTYHNQHPDQLGVDLPAIKRAVARTLDTEVFEYHIQQLIGAGDITRAASVFRLFSHEVAMSAADNSLWNTVDKALQEADLTPLRVGELATLIELTVEETKTFMSQCVAHGKVYKVTDNRYFLPQTLRSLANMAESLAIEDKLTVAEFRNSSGIGRNLVVELLEYFDRSRFTQRIGNNRRVLKSAEQIF